MNNIIEDLFKNLYSRKEELNNINILIQNEIVSEEDFILTPKGEILLRSGLVLLNAHWEGYIRSSLSEISKAIFCNNISIFYLYLKEDFFRNTIETKNNIKYEDLEKILKTIFLEDQYLAFNENIKNHFSNGFYYSKFYGNNNLFSKKGDKIDFKFENVSFLINDLIKWRNVYGHGYMENINLDKFKIIKTLDFKSYNTLYIFVVKFLEILSERLVDYILNRDYLTQYHKGLLEKNLNDIDSEKDKKLILILVNSNKYFIFDDFDSLKHITHSDFIVKHLEDLGLVKKIYIKKKKKTICNLKVNITQSAKYLLGKYTQKEIFYMSFLIKFSHNGEFSFDSLKTLNYSISALYGKKDISTSLRWIIRELCAEGKLSSISKGKYKLI